MRFTAEQYCDDVLSGRQVACRWVRLACERHRRDLAEGEARGLWFDERAAMTAVAFFSLLHHSKGEWAGQVVMLEPWQQFCLWMLFGWKRADGTRRFRTFYLEVARKNGKTTQAAGVGLYLLTADGEAGAEVYTAATKRDQARIAHGEAMRMVQRSPQLKREVRQNKDNLHVLATASKFEPLGRDADSLDGLNVHGAIVDEVHAHKTRDLWDVLITGMGARTQPLMYAITTAGFNRQSVCYELHEYSQKVVEGLVEDDSFFGLVYTIDEGDDWEDEANWIKANPNLGVSKKLGYMRQEAAQAKAMPAKLNSFLRLHLNVWTQASERWIHPDKWGACGAAVDVARLQGRRAWLGLDLSSTTDISSLVMVVERELGEPWWVVPWFWVPEEAMHERSRRDRVPYEAWVREGLIEATPGSVIDYDFILSRVGMVLSEFEVVELAFDRWGSQQVVNRLQEIGFTVDPKVAAMGTPLLVQFGQGFASMSAPMKELEKLILAEELAHGGNGVLSWMAGNVVATQDAAGNLKPDKSKSIEKIDGVVALVMALARATAGEVARHSVYEERGIRFV